MLCEVIRNSIGKSKKVAARDGYGPVYLLPVPRMDHLKASYWMIGDYDILRDLAKDLRTEPAAQKYVGRFPVRFGLRETDRPPQVDKQDRIGGFVRGDDYDADFTDQRDPQRQLADPVHAGPASTNRRTDQEKNRLTFWQTQTPQSHHIVEYNHLRDIGASQANEKGNGPMDHAKLPCVLLAAEFHQKYITEILRPTRAKGEAGLCQSLWSDYAALYERRGAIFLPLWQAAQVILTEAQKKARGLSLVSTFRAR